MNQIKLIIPILLILLTLAGCGGNEVEGCTSRGVAYFKEIGSYPTLTSSLYAGRSAEEVARERCNRTTSAF